MTDDLGFAGGTLLYLRIVGGSCAPHSCAVAAGPGQVTVNLALVSGPGYYLAYVADLHHEGSDPAAVYGSTGLVGAGGYTFSSLTRGDVYFFIVSVYEYVYNSQTNTWHLGSISGEITNEVAAP